MPRPSMKRAFKLAVLLLLAAIIILPGTFLFKGNVEQTHFVTKGNSKITVYKLREASIHDFRNFTFNVTRAKYLHVLNANQSLIQKALDEEHKQILRNNFLLKENWNKNIVPDPVPPVFSDTLPLNYNYQDCVANYTSFHTETFCLPKGSISLYFERRNTTLCYKGGTVAFVKNNTECKCSPLWHGKYCSIPDIAFRSDYPVHNYALQIVDPPRRLINAFPFTYEFSLLEARLHDLHEYVDLFVILESNYTASGKPKARLLLKKLMEGYLKEFNKKIFYVSLGFFPKEARYKGWIADALVRDYIAPAALSNIKNLNMYDIFVLNDADEIPMKEAFFFLKYHFGYPEPVGFTLTHNVYTFYWQGTDEFTHVFGACTIGMLLHVFKWKPYRLRSASVEMRNQKKDVDHFRHFHGGIIREWSFGQKSLSLIAGWHCSWCLPPSSIRLKLEAAHWSDLPRWGAYPSKTTMEYITSLIINGLWFDDRTKLLPLTLLGNPWEAPDFVIQHKEHFGLLLQKENKTKSLF